MGIRRADVGTFLLGKNAQEHFRSDRVPRFPSENADVP